MFILVLPYKKNKLHPIYRTIKSQDNFNKYQQHAKLWFAWKIVLLQYHKQLQEYGLSTLIVVICLKNRTFAVSQTTNSKLGRLDLQLWFAWKIVLLQYRKQPPAGAVNKCFCCDLLEKSYFCSIANNSIQLDELNKLVVICLKNRTFAVSQTTYLRNQPA